MSTRGFMQEAVKIKNRHAKTDSFIMLFIILIFFVG